MHLQIYDLCDPDDPEDSVMWRPPRWLNVVVRTAIQDMSPNRTGITVVATGFASTCIADLKAADLCPTAPSPH